MRAVDCVAAVCAKLSGSSEALGLRQGAANFVRLTVQACLSEQAFVNVLLAIGDPGDEVVLTKPYYFSHMVAIQLAGLHPVVADPDHALQPSVTNIAQSLTAKTKVGCEKLRSTAGARGAGQHS